MEGKVIFDGLMQTSPLWLPIVGWLAGQASASTRGRKVDTAIKKHFSWIKDKDAELAFRSAFESGIQTYVLDRGSLQAAKSVGRILKAVAEDGDTRSSISAREELLRQIFSETPDLKQITDIVRRRAWLIEDVTKEQVIEEMEVLFVQYLRPAFRNEQYFTTRIGFSQVIALLDQIVDSFNEEGIVDLEDLEDKYRKWLIDRFEYVSMEGISPKIQNRNIGLRIDDIYVPILASRHDRKNKNLRLDRQIFEAALRTRFNLSDDLENAKISVRELETLIEELSSDPKFRHRIGRYSNEHNHFQVEKFLRTSSDASKYARGIVLQGDPGSGKSTFTKHIAWSLANTPIVVGSENTNTFNSRRWLPLRIRANQFASALDKAAVDSLEEYLIDTTNKYAPLVKEALLTGRLLLLIDGLDEVSTPELRIKVRHCLDDFLAESSYREVRAIITTRIVGYERSGLVGQFPHYTLEPFSNNQIEVFARKWYEAIYAEMPDAINVEAEIQQLLTSIKMKPSIHRMAQNPLLLTIIALIKWQGRMLPDQRVLLYDAATQTLINSWPLAQRGVKLEELFIREWLAPVATHILTARDGDLVDEYTLSEILTNVMMELRSVTLSEARQESRNLLEDVSKESGIILPRGSDEDGRELYGFLHQTFAEYLTAFTLVGRWEENELDLPKLIHDPYWHEVLLLTAGHLGVQRRKKAGRFISEILDLQTSDLEQYLHRDFLLACTILGDGIPVGPGMLVDKMLSKLCSLWCNVSNSHLRLDTQNVIRKLIDNSN